MSDCQFWRFDFYVPYSVCYTSAVFTCIGAPGTPSRTGPLARKYLPGFPYSWSFAKVKAEN